MTISIKNKETERLAEALATLTGETKTAATTNALRDRLARITRERSKRRLADELDAIAERWSKIFRMILSTAAVQNGVGVAWIVYNLRDPPLHQKRTRAPARVCT